MSYVDQSMWCSMKEGLLVERKLTERISILDFKRKSNCISYWVCCGLTAQNLMDIDGFANRREMIMQAVRASGDKIWDLARKIGSVWRHKPRILSLSSFWRHVDIKSWFTTVKISKRSVNFHPMREYLQLEGPETVIKIVVIHSLNNPLRVGKLSSHWSEKSYTYSTYF